MAKSNEERVRFANDQIIGKGNLDVIYVESGLLVLIPLAYSSSLIDRTSYPDPS